MRRATRPTVFRGGRLLDPGRGLDGPGDVLVEVDERFFRPAEVESLVADASKARRELGWEPSLGFGELVSMMVEADLERIREG